MRLSRLLYRISMSPILEDGEQEDSLDCFDDYNPRPAPDRRISRAELQLLFGKELGANTPSQSTKAPAMSATGYSGRARQNTNLPYLLRASAAV